jgi:hypothetical protein
MIEHILRCADCRHFLPDEHDDPKVTGSTGLCKRYPPSLPSEREHDDPQAVVFGRWPAVYDDDSCGEFSAVAT